MLEFYLHNLWLWSCDLPENNWEIKTTNIEQTEWNVDFEQLMRHRLLMGALRYGKIGEKNKPKYDRISSMIKRLNKYNETGNKEFLVDVANLCLLEFVECNHPKAHFNALCDSEHVSKK